MRVPEEPVSIDLFRQNPVFTSLHLKYPVHVVPPLFHFYGCTVVQYLQYPLCKKMYVFVFLCRCVVVTFQFGKLTVYSVFLILLTNFRENNITTFFIVPPPNRRKPFLFNTLNVRNNLMTAGQLQGSWCTPVDVCPGSGSATLNEQRI